MSLHSLFDRDRDRYREMERLPTDLWLKIFCLLNHQSLATAQLVCRKWRIVGSDDTLWFNLFRERWGADGAAFFSPAPSKLWKDVYVTQDRGDRVGLGLKIIREGDDYYLVHLGEIQRHLGTRRPVTFGAEEFASVEEEPCAGILDKILFFLGDLESATVYANRGQQV